MPKKGFTLIEIIVSSVLIALMVTGLINIFVAGKRHILHSRSRISAGELGKIFLDPYMLSQDPSGTSCMDTFSCPATSVTMNGVTYASTYDVTQLPDTSLFRVTANITWNEPSP